MLQLFNGSHMFLFQEKSIMIVGHGANSMTMEEARAKLCAEAK